MSTLEGSLTERVRACRFAPEVDQLERIRGDKRLLEAIQDPIAVEQRRTARGQLLASAVRVDERMIPGLARTFAEIADRAGIDTPFEAYVHQSPEVNAFVGMGAGHLLIGLTSGAVELLDQQELEFVIGHELGHALFGHVDYIPGFALEHKELPPRVAMQLTAWQRASEISADRAGLLCCGDLDVASTAIFKTVSGLRTPGRIDARTFADQWKQLQQELILRGDRDQWRLSHPFPSMRLQALIAFAEAGGLDGHAPVEESITDADRAVQRLLAVMDPLTREDGQVGDPTLAEFMLWGGLYIALGEGAEVAGDLQHLDRLVAGERLELAMRDLPDRACCIQELQQARTSRDRKLRSLELYRIIESLTEAVADGLAVSATAHQSIVDIAAELGLNQDASEAIIKRVLKEEDEGEA